MPAEIKLIVIDESPPAQADAAVGRPLPGFPPPPDAPRQRRTPAGRRRPDADFPVPPVPKSAGDTPEDERGLKPKRQPAGRGRPPTPPPPAGTPPAPPPGDDPTEAERRRSYAFRVRSGAGRARQAEAERRKQYGSRVGQGVKAKSLAARQQKQAEAQAKAQARQDEAEKKRQYAFRVREAARRKRQAEADAAAKKRDAERAARQKQREAQRRAREREREGAQTTRDQRAQDTRGLQFAATIGQSGSASAPGKNQQQGAQAGALVGELAGGPIGAVVGKIAGEDVGRLLDGKLGGVVGPALDKLQDQIGFVGRAAQMAGVGLQRVAGNDALGAMEVGLEATSVTLDKIPFVGGLASESLRTFTKTLGAASAVVGAFAARARELEQYSGAISSASARRDVADIRADLRESDRLGDGYAALLQKLTVLEIMGRELLMPIKEAVVNRAAPAIDATLEIITALFRKLGELDPVFKKAADALDTLRRRAEAEAARGADFGAILNAIDKLPGLPVPAPVIDRGALPPGIIVGGA